jgi:hypothetical protein
MAWGDPYATVAEYSAQIRKTDSAEDAEILRNLGAISDIIDRECGRHFNRDATATTRIYVPSDPYSLPIDDVVSVSEVAVDTDDDHDFDEADTLTAATQYELWPLNAATAKADAWPYDEIRRVDQAWLGGVWPSGKTRYYRVRVTAIHGWPAVPAAIKEATIQLTAILRIESPRATTRIEEAGTVIGTSRAANEIIERLKDGYRKSPSVGSFYLV